MIWFLEFLLISQHFLWIFAKGVQFKSFSPVQNLKSDEFYDFFPPMIFPIISYDCNSHFSITILCHALFTANFDKMCPNFLPKSGEFCNFYHYFLWNLYFLSEIFDEICPFFSDLLMKFVFSFHNILTKFMFLRDPLAKFIFFFDQLMKVLLTHRNLW